MPDFIIGFVNYCYNSSDPLHQNWKTIETTAIAVTDHERVNSYIIQIIE